MKAVLEREPERFVIRVPLDINVGAEYAHELVKGIQSYLDFIEEIEIKDSVT